MNRQRQRRQNRVVASPEIANRATPPLAISYRRNASSSAEVYVSLAQITALNDLRRARPNTSTRRPPGPTHVSIEMNDFDSDEVSLGV